MDYRVTYSCNVYMQANSSFSFHSYYNIRGRNFLEKLSWALAFFSYVELVLVYQILWLFQASGFPSPFNTLS